MIPKIIHYCWFGGNELPPLAKKCIKSWKKYCKDYELREWNEQTFDIQSAPLYVRQAYEAKKWAFITDYVRLYAMTTFGGIYMDTDVEVVASLDRFLEHQAFSGFESEENIPTGIMACEKDFPLFLDFLRYYDDAVFVKEDGSLDMTPNVDIMTDICKERGLIQNNTFQVVEGFALYPKPVFCPANPCNIDVKKFPETVTIHWFAGSWLPDDEKKEKAEWMDYLRQKKKAQQRKKIKKIPGKVVAKILGKKTYDAIKSKIIKKQM